MEKQKIMSSYCQDCGCRVYNSKCTNCHEELFILDQYYEQEMEPPSEDSEFMKKVREQEKKVSLNNTTPELLNN